MDAGSRDPSDRTLALVGARILPSPTEEAIPDGVVLVRAGAIAAVGGSGAVTVPPEARVIDCRGLTVAAGFWNSHVHFFERKWAGAAALPGPELGRQVRETFTRCGFTSVFDLGSAWENTRAIRDRVESGEVPGPRIRSTGPGLVPPGALPSDTVLNLMGIASFPAPEIADAAQAAAASRALLDQGVDGIKLFGSSSSASLPEGAIRAAADEAHRSGRLAFVHPNTGADVLAAALGGIDVIAHTTPRSGPWDEATLAALSERGAALTPTLTLWRFFLRHDRVSVRDQAVAAARGQLRAWRDRGGMVLFGTDLGAVDPDPGEEYALMAEAGMSFREILASLTTAPAGRFGDEGRLGRIATGLTADLVALRGDPARDLHALTAVAYTLREGRIVFEAEA